MAPPAPTAAELQANPVVQATFAAAWAASLADDDAKTVYKDFSVYRIEI
jgi:hypothetical protein